MQQMVASETDPIGISVCIASKVEHCVRVQFLSAAAGHAVSEGLQPQKKGAVGFAQLIPVFIELPEPLAIAMCWVLDFQPAALVKGDALPPQASEHCGWRA